MKKCYLIIPLLVILVLASGSLKTQDPRAIVAKDMAVLINVTYDKSKPSITINWQKNELAYQYEVRRKLPTDANWGFSLGKLDVNTTSYTDTKVEVGKVYEYQVYAISKGKIKVRFVKGDGQQYDSLCVRDFIAIGYTYAGIETPITENQGKVLLLVDETVNTPLSAEIQTFIDDLKAEGWGVIRKTAPRAETFDPAKVKSTKQIIRDEYNKDQSNLKAVILLGRIAVPYSGLIFPDGHYPDHYGAWPADVYYACAASQDWADVSVNNSGAARQENKNIPGDGKFDPDYIQPGEAKVQLGRIDFFNMPAFKNDNEIALLKKYLDKNHKFRRGITKYQFKSIIDENFGVFAQEEFGSSPWRNFSNLLGAANVKDSDFFTTLDTANYMWAYGSGGGNYTGAGNVGNTDNFAAKQVKVVFTNLFGSYFGDWDATNAFMRAAIASQPSILTCAWVARPHWFFHHMGLGGNIGISTQATQNNNNIYHHSLYYLNPMQPTQITYNTQHNMKVHVALMGDPTLGMYLGTIAPPSNLSVTQPTDQPVLLSWTASGESGIKGYNIYRATSPEGPYRLLNTNIITATNYEDKALIDGMLYYLVRAVKLQQTNSGSFLNESPGISGQIEAVNNVVPAAPFLVSPSNDAPNQITNPTLKWESAGDNIIYGLMVSKSSDFSTDVVVQESKLSETEYKISNLQQKTKYYWKVNATNKKGTGPWSDIWSFTTKEKLASPEIVMPSNGAVNVNIPVITNWSKVTGATTYNLQVCKGSAIDEGNLLVNKTGIKEDYYYLEENILLPGTKYAWRIQAIAGEETSDWTETYTFSTAGGESVGERFDKENTMMVTHFPEPVTDFAFINFYLPKPENIRIELYNNLGVLMQVVAEGEFIGGSHQVRLLRNNLPSGAYFYKIKAGNLFSVHKLIFE